MATKTVTELIDDLDGGPADETVSFGLDGASYAIDLSDANAKQLRQDLERYVAAARVVDRPPKRKGKGRGKPEDRDERAKIRAWANSRGHAVGSKGRIPNNIVQAYRDQR